MTPIRIEQTTLIKFFPNLRKTNATFRIPDQHRTQTNSQYSLIFEPKNNIKIKETHCYRCNSRLVKNGSNPRFLLLNFKRGKRRFRVMRKRCPNCGEIPIELSRYAPKCGLYHERFKRMARQHNMEGLMPSQIVSVFKIDFNIKISKTTIVNWINEVAEPLRELLRSTPVPSSGYWGYDEIHMRISGERIYTLDAIDLETKFIPAATISESMGRKAGFHFFKETRKSNALWINCIVKDCTTNLGKLFRTRSFKHIIQQNCITHVKWMVSKHVKAFAGLSTRSKKPIPEKWRWLLKRFYEVIDASNETEAYVKLEILRGIVLRVEGKQIKHLYTALRQLISWLPKIIAHQRNPFIPTTNNLLESHHKKFTYYPSFKRNMMTIHGAQRVLDYRVFRHNYRRFPTYLAQYRRKYERWRDLVRKAPNDFILCGQGNHYASVFRKVNKWYGKYQELWNK